MKSFNSVERYLSIFAKWGGDRLENCMCSQLSTMFKKPERSTYLRKGTERAKMGQCFFLIGG